MRSLKNRFVNRILSYILLSGLLITCLCWTNTSNAQISLLQLDNNQLTYRQVLKQAKEDRTLILAVLYSPTYPVAAPNEFENAAGIIANYKVKTIVIDWASAPNQSPQHRYKELENPSWMLIHPEDLVISVNKTISNDMELQQFLETGLSLSDKIESAFQNTQQSKDPGHILALAKLCAQTYDTEYTSKVVDDFIKRINPRKINNQILQDILRVGIKGPYSKRLNRLINNDVDKAMMLTSVDTVLNIQRYYILNDLQKKGLLEPFYVWQRFERELGYDADSLYRMFAISYFSAPPIDAEMLYAEAFDFMILYPRSPWEYLDHLYKLIVPATSDKEDLNILLDLISFQLFREKTYRKLDYKAVILYKLDQKERALSMIEEINKLALEQGVLYRSMLYGLTSD